MPETDDDLMTMTWEDAGEAFADADAALLGTGSIEQHSIHLPVSVDTLRAEHLTEELVRAAPDHDLRFVRLPTLPWGYSEHHMNFPGTISLTQDTYKSVIVETAASLAEHGVDRLVVVNCHGGNRQPLQLAAHRITRDHDVAVHYIHWTDYARERLKEEFGEDWGHAGDHETSVIEFYRPDLVREDRKEPQEADDFPETASYRYFDDLTEKGGLGDPTNADPEVMREVVDEATGSILEKIAADMENGW